MGRIRKFTFAATKAKDSIPPLILFTAAVLFLAISAVAAPLQLATTIDPSIGPSIGGGGNSINPIISRDGRYVVFASTADNLALTSSNTPFPVQGSPKLNVFLRDRAQGTTTLVSLNMAGTGGGNGDSIPVDISTNGQYVLFESSASDLVPGDTNNATDVFVRDLVNGTNILVSVGLDGSIGNNAFGSGNSGQSEMTPDGRYVVFASNASNLVANDTNNIQDIFVRDLQNGTTVRATSDALGGLVPSVSSNIPYSSDSPAISPDGRYAAFITTFSYSSYPSLQNPSAAIFVSDLVAGVTTLVSSNCYINWLHTTLLTSCYNLAMSDDGQFLAFEVSTNAWGTGVIERYNLQTGVTDLVCSNAIAYQTGPTPHNLDITPDGRFIAFVVYSNYNSASLVYSNSFVYIWDGQTGVASLVSGDTNNAPPAGSLSDSPAVDSTGRYVAFLSTATTLTTNPVAGDYHLYLRCRNLRDPLAGTTVLLDADTNGVGFAKHFLNPPRLSSSGRFVAFECTGGMPGDEPLQ